jgi:hypothetical protein
MWALGKFSMFRDSRRVRTHNESILANLSSAWAICTLLGLLCAIPLSWCLCVDLEGRMPLSIYVHHLENHSLFRVQLEIDNAKQLATFCGGILVMIICNEVACMEGSLECMPCVWQLACRDIGTGEFTTDFAELYFEYVCGIQTRGIAD